MSAPLDLFALVRKTHGNDAWVHISPMYAATLRLALRARMEFDEDDMVTIANTYNAHHWRGKGEWENWYALAIDAHKSAAPAFEKMMRRKPFMLNGERVYVGRAIDWEGKQYRCTSIEANFIRAKRNEWDRTAGEKGNGTDAEGKCIMFPATLIEIPREGFEAKAAADKAKAAAERATERAAKVADPVTLRPLSEFFSVECASIRGRWGASTHIDRPLIDWAEPFGTDYKRAWTECNRAWWMSQWLVWIGLPDTKANNADAIRKRYSWPKVEQAIFRFVRTSRGLPLRDEVKP